ncbi:dirigent protein 22-like [Pyrus ussuriensis x Pyrus communis]|uniref:Dirigent protein n=1 Tax=Pyrus ussuriensis x Pyrus communis TaxID=2448454 RepID=A0A5N5G3B4_9ROSA|nr:dirigent protein 22-like [Pyrus ussuriensis x Pyrus communis]
MAKTSQTLPVLTSTLLIFSFTVLFSTTLGLKNQEKLSHLHFYFHDIVSGPNPAAVWIAQTPISKKSPTLFGSIAMFDDPLTVGPTRSSKLVGRAQGLYGSASQSEDALLMAMNFVFYEGNYNGSSLSVLGRNSVLEAVREMPVIGGSGVFRLARGYVQAKTVTFNATSGDALVEYDVFVFHY